MRLRNSAANAIRWSGAGTGPGTTGRERAVVLRAQGLVKTYGKRTVVDGVSFEVR